MDSTVFILALSCFVSMATVFGRPNESSHKVHNVILYPERHAWCEGKRIQQIIGHEDCEPQVIENTVCVGQCFTYSVPRTIPVNPEDKMLHYCDSCRPSKITWRKVKLQCNNKEVPELTILVEHVETCACQSCISNEYGLDVYNASFPDDLDVAEILYQADRFEWSKLQFSGNEHVSSELIPRQTADDEDGRVGGYHGDASIDDNAQNDGTHGSNTSGSHGNAFSNNTNIEEQDVNSNQTNILSTTSRPRRRYRVPLH